MAIRDCGYFPQPKQGALARMSTAWTSTTSENPLLLSFFAREGENEQGIRLAPLLLGEGVCTPDVPSPHSNTAEEGGLYEGNRIFRSWL